MRLKILYPEPDGSLRFSKQEIQELLEEAYRDGYEDGKRVGNITYWPSNTGIMTTPYYTLTSSSSNGTSSGLVCDATTINDSVKSVMTGYKVEFENK